MATSSFTLSDGTYIPRGTSIAVAGEAMALDSAFYGPDPDKFDGRRFLNADGKPASPEREFHGIEPGNAMWGAGRLTCPGRHYASALGKLILVNLLLKYDLSFPPGQVESPRGVQDDGNLVPDMKQMIVLAERT
jgi:cytochrome P450